MAGAGGQLRRRIHSDLTAAMRDKRAAEVSALRSLLAAIDDAEAPPAGDRHDKYRVGRFGDPSIEVPRSALSGVELQQLLHTEIAVRLAAAGQLSNAGRDDRAALLKAEAELLRTYLD